MSSQENWKNAPLWTPSDGRVENSVMRDFANICAQKTGLEFDDYDALHAWSVDQPEQFWNALWDYCDVIGDKGEVTLRNPDKMPGAEFFPEGSLSFAQNMMRRNDNTPAMILRGEDKVRRTMSWAELHALVSRLQQAFVAEGVKIGDRIAAMVPNMPETVASCWPQIPLGLYGLPARRISVSKVFWIDLARLNQ